MLLSIIIPVFNTPYDVLCDCIKSILTNELSDFEIIIIDDGSDLANANRYRKLANKVGAIYTRFDVNNGPSFARNRGLELAKGDYISFIDSDDTVSNRFYSNFCAIEKKPDIYMTRIYRKDLSSNFITRNYFWDVDPIELNGIKSIELLFSEDLDCSVCNKIFSKNLFVNNNFIEGKICEELPVLVNAFLKTNKIVYTSEANYVCIRREKSVTTSPFSNNQFDKISNSHLVSLFIYPTSRLAKMAKVYYLKQCFYLYKKLILDAELKSRFKYNFQKIKKSLWNSFFLIMLTPHLNYKTKISILYCMMFPHLYAYSHRDLR